MAKVTFNEDICKGCGLCVNACPKHILAIAKDKATILLLLQTRKSASAVHSAQPCAQTV